LTDQSEKQGASDDREGKPVLPDRAIQGRSCRASTGTGSTDGDNKAIIERIERIWRNEKKTISDDIRDIYAEAKGNGYDVKALRSIVRMRKQDANDRQEQETILETYMHALGML
jgi:uncharacterized protein (UPF0335 family)